MSNDLKLHGVVRYSARGREHVAVLDLRTVDGGSVRLEQSLPLEPLEQQIKAQGQALPDEAKQQLEQDRVAGIPGADAVRNLARRVASSRLRRSLEMIVNDPRTKLGASLAEKLVPGWGATAGAVRAATSLVSRARQGDKAARTRVAQLAAAAPSDPRAASALALVRKVGAVTKDGGAMPPPPDPTRGRCCTDDDQRDDVGGWLWNVPYRTPAQVLLDTATGHPSPGMIARGLYAEGLRARAQALAARR